MESGPSSAEKDVTGKSSLSHGLSTGSLEQRSSSSTALLGLPGIAQNGRRAGVNKAPVFPGFIGRLCCGVRVSNCVLFYFIVFYTVYLILGALGFSFLEEPIERSLKRQLDLDIKSFLADHKECLNDTSLDVLLEKVIQAHNRGVSPHPNVTTEPNWSFGQAFFFSGTVVTTIGYGHVAPLSKEGKLFCIFYAAIGIPLTFTLFSAIVERLLIPATHLQVLIGRMFPRASVFTVRLLHVLTLGLLTLGFVFLLPACGFYALEPGWDYLDSVYYCFISLTTIGLGDFVPGDAPSQPLRPIYKVLAMVYLLVGLSFVMLFIEVFISVPGFNLGACMSLSYDTSSASSPGDNGDDEEEEEDRRQLNRRNNRLAFRSDVKDRDTAPAGQLPRFVVDTDDDERLPIRAYARRYTEETEVGFQVDSGDEEDSNQTKK